MKYVSTEKDRRMLETVFRWHTEHVQPNMVNFKKGVVHNDLNCDNLICVKETSGETWEFSGLIDVTDTIMSYSVFDGAIFIACMMAEECTNPLEYTEPAVSGYLSNYKLNKEEFDCLYYLVVICLSQMFLEGLNICSLHPENSYQLRFMERSHMALKILFDTSKEKVDKLWKVAEQKTILHFHNT